MGSSIYARVRPMGSSIYTRVRRMIEKIWNHRWVKTLFLVVGILFLFLFGIWYLGVYANELEKVWLKSDINYFDPTRKMPVLSAVSANGRWIVFASDVDKLVDGDTNESFDVFLLDRETHATTRISVSSEGGQANGWSQDPSISPDGRYVIFSSVADNLVKKEKKETEAAGRLFIHDVISHTTTLLNDVPPQEQTTETGVQGQPTITTTIASSMAEAIDASFLAAPALLSKQWWLPTTRWERLRLYDQRERARGLANRHLEVAMYYYQQYFTSITLATLSVIVAAICLAYITRTGWQSNETSPYLITAFIVMTASSIFFTALPNFFQYSKNIDANKKAFVAAATLENQIMSYISTGKVLSVDSTSANQAGTSTSMIPPSEFIVLVDRQLVELFALPIEMNPEMIPDSSEILTRLIPQGSQ